MKNRSGTLSYFALLGARFCFFVDFSYIYKIFSSYSSEALYTIRIRPTGIALRPYCPRQNQDSGMYFNPNSDIAEQNEASLRS